MDLCVFFIEKKVEWFFETVPIPRKVAETLGQLINIGDKRKVLFESENKNGFIHGYSDNYIRVKTLWASNLVDNINNVVLDKIDSDNLVIARNI